MSATSKPAGRAGRAWRSGRGVAVRTQAAMIVVIVSANLMGVAVVFVLGWVLAPPEALTDQAASLLANAILTAAYVAVAFPIGILLGTRHFAATRGWLVSDRAPTRDEQRAVLRGPLYLAVRMGVLWAIAALLFGALNLLESWQAGVVVGLVVAFGGISTTAVSYLLAERVLREAASRALAAGAHERLGVGVGTRSVLTWALVTGVPVLGLVGLGIASLAGSDEIEEDLGLAAVALGGIALGVGLLATILASRATSVPIVSLRRALARVEEGDLDARVRVWDGTELGLLQAGFNRMAAGLQEREQLRDLFGRHVGRDVAGAALERGVDLGGEVAEVSVLFVDLVGSTKLAADRPPTEVVGLLNRFFAVVVEVVEAAGGSVNKFEGDAALAVFGVPVPLDDHATCALRAARTLAERIREEVPELEAGIGVSGGSAVAGNVGAAHRFEYTVIGDPVNEAARLTELAKSLEGPVAASAALVEAAGADERERWREADEVTLRGRGTPTRVLVPER